MDNQSQAPSATVDALSELSLSNAEIAAVEPAAELTTTTLDEMHKLANGKYSKKEIKDFIAMGTKFSQKAVLTLLMKTLRHNDIAANSQLLSDIAAKITVKSPAFSQIEVNTMDIKLNVQLTISEKDFKVPAEVPDDTVARELFAQYDFLKRISIAFWRQWREDYPELFKRITAACPKVDFSELIIASDIPTLMYFDETAPERISVFCYWVDAAGNPFRKAKTREEKKAH
jgi:hypothetical protein